MPKYIGPYKVVKAHNEASTVMLELPLVLVAQWISPMFHMGLVWKFVADNDKLFPKRDAKSFYDFSQDDEQEWLVEEITFSLMAKLERAQTQSEMDARGHYLGAPSCM